MVCNVCVRESGFKTETKFDIYGSFPLVKPWFLAFYR